MDVLLKASILFLTSSLVGVLLRKGNPELTLVLSLTAITTVFILAAAVAEELRVFADAIQSMTENSTLTSPVWKCLAIAAVTRVTSELCRDASQGAASSAMELTGTLCAMCVAMPLILSLARTIGGLL